MLSNSLSKNRVIKKGERIRKAEEMAQHLESIDLELLDEEVAAVLKQ
jgi:hypothetical protein